MPLELQVKLLRVLETGQFMRSGGDEPVNVDVRVIAATNRDPHEAVRDGKMREDLLYRLKVFPVHLPPLRERGEDVDLLAGFFLGQLNERHGTAKVWTAAALDRLRDYPWPGNVRELQERGTSVLHHGRRRDHSRSPAAHLDRRRRRIEPEVLPDRRLPGGGEGLADPRHPRLL